MKINLKDNIWIEGFKTLLELTLGEDLRLERFDIIYSGKTSEISERIAKKCVYSEKYSVNDLSLLFQDYNNFGRNGEILFVETAKESIQSVCDKEYCIIYKIN